jgi:hypothetical protein
VYPTDDPTLFYYIPDHWVLEDGIGGPYWSGIADNMQYYSPSDVAMYQRNGLNMSLRLESEIPVDEIDWALQLDYPGARLKSMPMDGLQLAEFSLFLPEQSDLLNQYVEFDPLQLRVLVETSLTKAGFEALTIFLRERSGIALVELKGDITCNDGSSSRTIEIHPQTNSADIEYEADSIVLEESAGEVAKTMDLFMNRWTGVLRYSFATWDGNQEIPDYDFDSREAELDALLRPLLNYDGESVGPVEVRAAGASLQAILEEVRSALAAKGHSETDLMEFAAEDLGVGFYANKLATFEGETRLFWLDE